MKGKFVWIVEVREPDCPNTRVGDAYTDLDMALRVLEREREYYPDLEFTLHKVQVWHKDSI